MHLDPISRVNFLMNYDLSKTSKENLKEQTDQKTYTQLRNGQEHEAYLVLLELENEKTKKAISPGRCKSCLFSKTGQLWKEVDEYTKSKRQSDMSFIFGGEKYASEEDYAKRANDIICINYEFLNNPEGSTKWCDKGYGLYSTLAKEYNCIDIEDCRKKGKKLIESIDTKPMWDNSDVSTLLQTTAIVTGLLGAIPSPMSPVLLGTSLAAELADASRYAINGDYYTATIFGLLALIPAHQLFQVLRKSSIIKELGKEGIVQLLKKVKSGKASPKELKMLKHIVEEFGSNAEGLRRLVKINLIRNITKNLSKQNSKTVLKFVMKLHKLGIINIFKFTFLIGGIPILADRLYVWVNRDLIPNSALLDKREKSDLIKMVRSVEMLIKGNDTNLSQDISSQLDEPLFTLEQKDKLKSLFEIEPEERLDAEQELKNILEEEKRRDQIKR